MTARSVHKIATFLGFVSFFHAAYSAVQHRSYLRITEQEFTTLPIDVSRFLITYVNIIYYSLIIGILEGFETILIQSIASLFAIMYGVMHIAGDFKEIRAVVDLENKTWDTLRNLPSFMTFNHRGMALSPEYLAGETERSDKREKL